MGRGQAKSGAQLGAVPSAHDRLVLEPETACAGIHALLEGLPLYRTPAQVPFADGLYVFYERGEVSPHAPRGRVVRIGNHPRRDGRLVARLKEHYRCRRDAKNGSVFRLLLGGALLRQDDPDSLCLAPSAGQGHWERHMQKECDRCAPYEQRINDLLMADFSFRCIAVPDRTERNLMEVLLVATIAACAVCAPSAHWLGRFSSSPIVQGSGLWNREFVGKSTMSASDLERFGALVAATPAA